MAHYHRSCGRRCYIGRLAHRYEPKLCLCTREDGDGYGDCMPSRARTCNTTCCCCVNSALCEAWLVDSQPCLLRNCKEHSSGYLRQDGHADRRQIRSDGYSEIRD